MLLNRKNRFGPQLKSLRAQDLCIRECLSIRVLDHTLTVLLNRIFEVWYRLMSATALSSLLGLFCCLHRGAGIKCTALSSSVAIPHP